MWKGTNGVFSNISNSNIVIETRYKKQELIKTLNMLSPVLSVSI